MPSAKTSRAGNTHRLSAVSSNHKHAGEWLVHELGPEGARFDRLHAKGDAAVRGRASDLLLWLWRRPASVEVLGDAGVAARFVAHGMLA